MIPGLKKKNEVSVSMPAEVIQRKPDNEPEYDPMEAAADDLISAVHSKSTKAVAAALRAAFQLADMEPHEEGPHVT